LQQQEPSYEVNGPQGKSHRSHKSRTKEPAPPPASSIDNNKSSAYGTFDVDEEELPAYPPIQSGAKSAAIGSRSSYTRRDDEGAFGGDEVEDTRPQRKPKPATAPKKKKSTTRTADGTATEYKTEKNGMIETRIERQVTVPLHETDIDHDLALAEAIEAVTEVNTDLNVEKIEIKTKPKKPRKPKKLVAAATE
jgi:hypothetical protein